MNKNKFEKYKTIYFGLKGHKYCIDGEKIRLSKTKYKNDYFHPKFWELNLLDKGKQLK